MDKHPSAITHLDWSEDSNYLHSNSTSYDILYSDLKAKTFMPGGASALKDCEWHTWSATFGWHVQGVFRSEMDQSDINMVARSNKKYGKGKSKYQILSTGDDDSLIRLYRYPCLEKNSGCVEGRGHAEHVTNTKWSSKDTYLYSAGGEDQCVMQWRVNSKGRR